MEKLNFFDWLAGAIVTLGGLNMGLYGFFKYDLLVQLLGDGSTWHRVVLGIIGLAAVYMISFVFRAVGYAEHHAHA
jgi:uncharacterized membrane protein YuzA (DUF378 family)